MTAGSLLQSAIVALVVLAAAAYLARALWRTVSSARRARAAGGCRTGCGCGTMPESRGGSVRVPGGRGQLGGP